jgi:hypothetical protein
VPKAQGYGSAKGTSSIKCKPRSRFFHHIPWLVSGSLIIFWSGLLLCPEKLI